MLKILIVLHHRSVDLVVFLVLISCHPVSQPSKRGRDIFVGESFGGRQGELVWLFSLMMGFVYISALQSCLRESFSYHSMMAVVNLCIVCYLDILS